MTRRALPSPRSIRGFTLIEAIIVAIILGVIAVGIGRVQLNLFSNHADIKDLQIRTAVVQACAEQVLAFRKSSAGGYESVDATGVAATTFDATHCGGMSVPAGYSISAIVADYSGAACPANGICKTVTITSGTLTSLTLMLVNY